MKKKILISVVLIIMLLTAAFIGWLVYGAYSGMKEDQTADIPEEVDLDALAATNADTAFSFLTIKKNEMPDNMRGYVVDPETDIDFSDMSEVALKDAVDNVFRKVDAMLPNTAVVMYSGKKSYKSGDFNYLKYLVEAAHTNDLKVIFSVSGEDYPLGKLKGDKFCEIVDEYGADAVMIQTDSLSQNNSAVIAEVKSALNGKNAFFGIALPEKQDEIAVNSVKNSEADFYFINIDSSTETGAESIIKSWADPALESKSKVYAVLRNDLVKSGSGWTNQDEINRLVKILYNNGGFAGCVMRSHEKLASDDNNTTTNLYSYYEFFNDSDYTALTLTDFSLKDGITAVFKGTSDVNYPVHVWSTGNGKWQKINAVGDKGEFTAEIPLEKGQNKILLKHKNAMYTYHIDRAVDVLEGYSAESDGENLTLTALATPGSRVWASLANTVLVELSEQPASDDEYATYSAVYKLEGGLAAIQENQISFAAEYDGITDIVMCGKEKDLTPYDNHECGTALMCVITKDHAETTPASNDDDSSDPLYTPQLAGSYGYVDSFTVIDNHINYITTSGMKIHSSDARLIVGGYVFPENNITLENISVKNNSTELTFSSVYPTFTRTVLSPQEYYVGFLQRIYNVKEFTAEYLDIMFTDTDLCSVKSEFDFTNNPVISHIEWFTNTDEHIIILRLYLRNKNSFSGYSMNTDENGNTVLKIKYNPSSLEGTVIMLDPGHGGYGSPGTYSALSVYEKDVTLAIAQKTAAILRDLGATVILTRNGDDAVFLGERADLIRSCNPDIFASIHCDGNDSDSMYGTHTFYYRNYSMPLAMSIHNQLVKAYRNYYYTDPSSEQYENVDLGYKFFPYNVTRVEECPSVLVECGYLTNYNDAVFLTDGNSQNIVATAIAQGIVDYIENY